MTGRKRKKSGKASAADFPRIPSGAGCPGIPAERIRPFRDYPFRITDDDRMHELVEDIMMNGMLTPVIVRETEEDGYEMISGHRRLFAAKQIGLTEIPAVIREFSDDEAVMEMVDSGLQREDLLISEKAFAYRMRYEALRRSLEKQSDRNRTRVGNHPDNFADEVTAEAVGESRTQLHRYLRLTHLIPDILELVDSKAVAVNAAVEISFLDPMVQRMLYAYMLENGICRTYQIYALREYLKEHDTVPRMELIRVLNESAPVNTDNTFQKIIITKEKLKKYFPVFFTKSQMENVLFGLLSEWKKDNN